MCINNKVKFNSDIKRIKIISTSVEYLCNVASSSRLLMVQYKNNNKPKKKVVLCVLAFLKMRQFLLLFLLWYI